MGLPVPDAAVIQAVVGVSEVFESTNEALQRSRCMQFCRNVIGLRHNA
jgi:hypothetical protein